MKKKLQSDRGETLVEVLASILICSLSVALLVSAVTASTNIDQTAQAADAAYYEALTKTERRGASDVCSAFSGVKLKALDQTGVPGLPPSPALELDVTLYGTDQLLAYALAPQEAEAGGGG